MTTSRKAKKDATAQDVVLSLTKNELAHIRNMMSIVLPPTGEVRLSESLEAASRHRGVDKSLWRKVCKSCEEAGVEVGESAPDFVVGPSEPMSLTVYAIEEEEEEQ